jgi:hypothetical protein
VQLTGLFSALKMPIGDFGEVNGNRCGLESLLSASGGEIPEGEKDENASSRTFGHGARYLGCSIDCENLRVHQGICVSTHRVKGTPPYATGYVFGPNYSYTTLSDIPQPVVSYYKLGPDMRYVYSNGYLYEVDPNTYAVTKVIDTYPH